MAKKSGSDDKIYKAIKYRLHPTKEQAILFNKTFGCARKAYNFGIEVHMGLAAAGFPTMSSREFNNYCNRSLKEDYEFMREVDKFAITNAVFNVYKAYDKHFKEGAGWPKWKSRKASRQSYTTNITGNNIVIDFPKDGKKGRIKLPKAGWVDACIHRRPWPGAVLKSVTVELSPAGNYSASVLYELDRSTYVQARKPVTDNALGIDYSSPHFYVDSDGYIANPPHWYREAEDKLAREQRKLSRMQVGSNNYEKQRKKVAKLHEHVSDCRKDFCHKLSREIANLYDVVCVEDINLQTLSQSLQFGKATMDNGFGMFRTFLRYKLEEQGKHYVVIGRWFPSSKRCRHCKEDNDALQLGQFVWTCPHCRRVIDRDYNAALNIRDEGLRMLRTGAVVAA